MPEKRPNGLTLNSEFKKACEWSTLTVQAVDTVNHGNTGCGVFKRGVQN